MSFRSPNIYKDYILELETKSKQALDLFEIDLEEFIARFNKGHQESRIVLSSVELEDKL